MSKKQYEMRAKFIEGYCEHGNATKAARDAGYKDGKYITNQAGNLKKAVRSTDHEAYAAKVC